MAGVEQPTARKIVKIATANPESEASARRRSQLDGKPNEERLDFGISRLATRFTLPSMWSAESLNLRTQSIQWLRIAPLSSQHNIWFGDAFIFELPAQPAWLAVPRAQRC